jgi:hypothetical protein
MVEKKNNAMNLNDDRPRGSWDAGNRCLASTYDVVTREMAGTFWIKMNTMICWTSNMLKMLSLCWDVGDEMEFDDDAENSRAQPLVIP